MMFFLVFLFLCNFLLVTTQARVSLSKEEELRNLAAKNPLISLDGPSFKYFTQGEDRNYSLFVNIKLKGYNLPSIFINMAEYLKKIAESSVQRENRHIENIFFAKISDNELAKKYCQRFNFGVMPVIVHFPAHSEPTRKDIFDIRWNSLSLDSLNFWVRSRALVQITIVTQFSFIKFGLFLSILATFGAIYYYMGSYISAFNTRNFWSIVLLTFVCVMLGGIMHVIISGSPLVNKQGDSISVISDGMRGQYGLEAYIIAFLYMGIVYNLIQLNNFTPKSFKLNRKLITSGALAFFLGGLLYVIKIKAPWLV